MGQEERSKGGKIHPEYSGQKSKQCSLNPNDKARMSNKCQMNKCQINVKAQNPKVNPVEKECR
ncbi:MAG: hypothetical protein ACOCUF_01115 [Patescibacteria group bacterium]